METQQVQAYIVARKHFPKAPAKDLLDSIDLCSAAGGLYVKPEITFAFFRYHPGQWIGEKRMFDVVCEWDIETLKQLDLSDGPCVHVMFFETKVQAYKTFRRLIDALNAEAVSGHRFKKNGERHFSFRSNQRYKHAL